MSLKNGSTYKILTKKRKKRSLPVIKTKIVILSMKKEKSGKIITKFAAVARKSYSSCV